jgi:hypothetical protein
VERGRGAGTGTGNFLGEADGVPVGPSFCSKRTSVKYPHASSNTTTIPALRIDQRKEDVTSNQRTQAAITTGSTNTSPIWTDERKEGWKKGQATAPAAAHASRPRKRSLQRRRLPNSHQTPNAEAPKIGAQNTLMKWTIDPGANHLGTKKQSHWRATMATPGHKRKRRS